MENFFSIVEQVGAIVIAVVIIGFFIYLVYQTYINYKNPYKRVEDNWGYFIREREIYREEDIDKYTCVEFAEYVIRCEKARVFAGIFIYSAAIFMLALAIGTIVEAFLGWISL